MDGAVCGWLGESKERQCQANCITRRHEDGAPWGMAGCRSQSGVTRSDCSGVFAALGNRLQREGKPGYTCASNEANAARHIWDMLDAQGHKGATACVVVPAFWDAHQGEGDWQIMARWIADNLPFSELGFFPTYWAMNVSWHEVPKRAVSSYAAPKGRWGS